MRPADPLTPMVLFFKALADENRLRIVSLLANKPHSVEEIAANLGISSATVSHHLQRLLAAELVEARAMQYYNVYTLRADFLRQSAERFLSLDEIGGIAKPADWDAYSEQVLKEYIRRGRLRTLPSQVRKRQVILRHLAREFEPGKRYREEQVDGILRAFHADYVALRRALVASRTLLREGTYYRRRTEKPEERPLR